MLESRESPRKKRCTEVVKEFLLEKHQYVPLMQQFNKDVEDGVKNIVSQSIASSFDAQAFSALIIYGGKTYMGRA